MSESDANRSPSGQQLNYTGSDQNPEDDAANRAANNSIMGKVKSRVSSILPNSLSKWFSPSTKSDNNEPLNGSLDTTSSGRIARRRRRLEIDDEEEEEVEEDEDEDLDEEEHETDHHILQQQLLSQQRSNYYINEEYNNVDARTMASPTTARGRSRQFGGTRQPPYKRSRFSSDLMNEQGSPLLTRQPLIASTPAVGSNKISNTVASKERVYDNRYSYLNLYGNREKESAYNFLATEQGSAAATAERYGSRNALNSTELLALPEAECEEGLDDNSEQNQIAAINSTVSSRRSLNIPAIASPSMGLTNLKRQSLSSWKADLPSTSAGLVRRQAIPNRTSSAAVSEIGETNSRHNKLFVNSTEHNGNIRSSSAAVTDFKRRKTENGGCSESAEQNLIDDNHSASDSSVEDNEKDNSVDDNGKRRSGLFNMSSAAVPLGTNSRAGSRTSSFGNGLNFYTHLEGRKSLFAGAQGNANTIGLNNSTLSLNSLNRRQFNASIYGSTSALSDSRLLNTFSPFYKGKTMYGGAAAYHKQRNASGDGSNSIRIAPTLIRPTSSLSTLSSSNNSIAGVGVTAGGANLGSGETSTISNTAKRILDLINDFATPLSEAKKMANNLKTNPRQQLQTSASLKSTRLTDADIQASRAMRLSQIRTPYVRPVVTLQSNSNLNNDDNKESHTIPPVRELQVPSMSQLLQMKKMQNTTERSRQIATHQPVTSKAASAKELSEYELPKNHENEQQKHTNKMKNKNWTMHSSAADDEVLQPLNLPTIAFPLMQSIPKIDIPLPKHVPDTKTSPVKKVLNEIQPPTFSEEKTKTNSLTFKSPSAVNKPISNKAILNGDEHPSVAMKSTSVVEVYKFSTPQKVNLDGIDLQAVNAFKVNGNFKFSPPAAVNGDREASSHVLDKVNSVLSTPPKLKSGSVLDALKEPFVVSNKGTIKELPKTSNQHIILFGGSTQKPSECFECLSKSEAEKKNCAACKTTQKSNTTTTKSTEPAKDSSLPVITSSFGSEFKKSSNEWDCDTCMIRNKQELEKCIACETPRKSNNTRTASLANPLPVISSTFGNEFKKSNAEWECDTCMIRNKNEVNKCVACETPRKGMTGSSFSVSKPTEITSTSSSIKNTFGDAFKPKSDTWECSTCLIVNKNDCNACVACETKKPGASSSTKTTTTSSLVTPKYKFGFDADTKAVAADAGFKSLAMQQKTSKWECEACMTQNEAKRSKCICCDQAKPGSLVVDESVPKFSFGATASKYTFGFEANRNTTKETLTSDKTETNSKGFTFGVANTTCAAETNSTTTSSSTFSFGFKPTATATAQSKEEGKDVADASKTAASVTFGIPNTITAKETSTTTSSTANFSLPTATIAANTTAASTATATKPLGKFTFGSAITSTQSTTASTNNAATFKAPATFSFGLKASPGQTTTTTTNATSTTPAAAVKPMFTFGSASSTSAPTTTTTTSTFGFGSNATSSSDAATPAKKTLFGTTDTSSTTTPNTVAQSLFGAQPSNINPLTSTIVPSKTTTASTVPAFGASFNNLNNTANANVFGSAQTVASSNTETKPMASATPLFGATSSITTSSVTASTTTNAQFAFGSSVNSTTTASTWPTNNSVFGNANNASTITPAFGSAINNSKPAFGSANNDSKPAFGSTSNDSKPVFGSFVQPQQSNNAATSVFGSLSSAPESSVFGSPAAAQKTTIPQNTLLFGSNATPAAQVSSTSVFGASTAFGGSSPFGSAAANTIKPAFGTNTTTAPAITFGSGFGSNPVVNSDGASAAKKSEPMFNFGASSTNIAQQNTTGGFNFNAPTAAQPFKFGSSTQPPAFNFSNPAEQTTSNAPFQFSAGSSMPASNNIFAPTPTPGTPQTAQQTRRQKRQPIRRR